MSFSNFLNNPRPLRIIELDDNQKLNLNEKNLRSVLFHPKARNKPVCVISIAGTFRKGKSFILNFFLRFFRNGGRDGWLENESDLLKGFHWRGGSDRDTTGIFLWSEPFVLRTVKNEEVAVLLMDTQGAFDSSTAIKDCASLFALSLMISSMQIFNLSQNIQENDLQNLQFFSDYGRLAIETTSETAFQALIFLVRDWQFNYEHHFGFKGGLEFLTKRLNVTFDDSDIKETRSFIKNCFQDLKCFLMPHPGLKASTNPYFNGKLNDIDPLFRVHVVNFVEGMFQENMFKIKEINGQKVSATELFEYFKIYFNTFKNNQMPNPKSLLKATAEANNLAAKALAKEFYNKKMEMAVCSDRLFLSQEQIEKIHINIKLESIKYFESIKKMGGLETSRVYLKELIFELDQLFVKFYESNQLKKSNSSTITPTTLLFLIIFSHFMHGFFSFIWMGFLALFFKIEFYISLVTLIFWIYSKYQMQNIQTTQTIDSICLFIWDNVIQILGGKFLKSIVNLSIKSLSGFDTNYFEITDMKTQREKNPSNRGDSK